MNNSPSHDLYPVREEEGIFARYLSTYKCVWHNCWDTAALTCLSLIRFLLNRCVYIALSCFSSLLKSAQQHRRPVSSVHCSTPDLHALQGFHKMVGGPWRSATWVPLNTLPDPSVFGGSA